MRKFTPEFEQAIRDMLPHEATSHVGPSLREHLRRETFTTYKSGFTVARYTWNSGHVDQILMQPPGAGVKKKFTAEYQEFIREETNKNGRGNAAYDQQAEQAMLPQTELVYEDITDMDCGGIACEYGWTSKRQDVLIYPLHPGNAEKKALEVSNARH